MANRKVDICLEKGAKRSFAAALDWPGWCRSGKTPDDAVAALVAYGERYARVARRARISFTPARAHGQLTVVEELKGTATTEFGAPGVAARADERPMDADELGRQVKLLRAAWDTLDATVESARGRELRTGPRGGGRDLSKIVDHVIDAEEAYLGGLGAKLPRDPAPRNKGERLRHAVIEAVTARVEGRPVAEPRNTKNPWSPRFFLRRAAWHVLDHAWEIEDRLTPEGGR